MNVGLYFFTFHGQYQYCELFKCLQTHPSKNNPPLVRSVTKWDTQTLRGLSWKKCMHVCIKKLSDLYNYVLALSIKVKGLFRLHIFRRRSHLHYQPPLCQECNTIPTFFAIFLARCLTYFSNFVSVVLI